MESTTTAYKSDNNAEDPKQISVSILTEKSQICYKEEGNAIVMASLKAPLNVEEKQRAPIDLVVVVDVSGSMRGSKLELVQSTLEFIIKELNQKDRLSIVSFQSVVRVELQLTNMDEHGKSLASQATKKLSAAGGTALCGGLVQGLNVMRTRKDPNEVASVLLLTDGHANAGPNSTTDIIAAMMNPNFKVDGNSYQQRQRNWIDKDSDEPTEKKEEEPIISQQGLPCTVNTFGYGDNHNATMLKDIAEAADGVYYFIDNDEKVAESFADCLGGLLSVVAQNILMTFEAQNGASIKKMLTKYRTTEITPNKAYQVHMGDIQSEEKRDILCNLIIEPLKEPKTNNPIVNIKIEYFNVLTTTSIAQTFVTSIERPEVVTAKDPTPVAIDIQRNRIITSDAIEEAKSLASKNKLEEGQKVIEKAMAILKASPSANESSVGRLLRDLTDCLSSMTDVASYQRGGHQKMENMWHAHAKQRSTGYEDSMAEKEYETSNRKVMKQKFKK